MYSSYPRISRKEIKQLRNKFNKQFQEYVASLPEDKDLEVKDLKFKLNEIQSDFTNKINLLKEELNSQIKNQVGKGKKK